MNEQRYFYSLIRDSSVSWGDFHAINTLLKKSEVSCDFCVLRIGRLYRILESDLGKLDQELDRYFCSFNNMPSYAQKLINENRLATLEWYPVLDKVYAEVSPSGFGAYPSGVYPCKYPWDCFVQGGGNGIVVDLSVKDKQPMNIGEMASLIMGEGETPRGYYRTAFFEAFPDNPSTFIRGEGKTIEEAEEKAWKHYQKYKSCPKHEYESQGYENGGGFCKHCGMFGSNVIPSTHACPGCGKMNWFSKDKTGEFWCEQCLFDGKVPEDSRTEIQKEVLLLRQKG